jgi:hypothetical protein
MESSEVDRPVTRFQLNLPAELRERLESYVTRANALFYPMKLTMTDVVLAALGEYLDRHESDVSAG